KLFNTIRFCRLALPGMKTRRWGRILNVVNDFAKAPQLRMAPTAVTRAAQMTLTKVLANEYGPPNVLANALVLGALESDAVRARFKESGAQSFEDFERTIVERLRIPLGRIGKAEELASLACFLASEEGGYINGAAINVDGGKCPVL